MRELVLTCAMAVLVTGCVNVVSHRDEFDAGPDVKPSDASGEPEASGGQCASGVRWTMGPAASGLMSPGVPCMGSGCHTSSSKTQFTMAGTVYGLNGPHDENNCNGTDNLGAVVPIDDMGNELIGRIQLNGVGNFATNKGLPASYKVKVIQQGREIAMIAPVTDGNCNGCHSPDGVGGAKGRIIPMAP